MSVTVGLDTAALAGQHTGTEEVLEGLLYGLEQVGQPVVALGHAGQRLDPSVPGLGLAPTPRPSHRAKWRWETTGLARAAAAADVNVVHVPYLAHPPRALSVPTVVTVHDLIPYLYPGYQRRVAAKIYFRRVARHVAYAHRLVAVSESTWHDIAVVFPAWHSRVAVIPNGVHPAYFAAPDPVEVQRARAELHLAGDEPLLLYAGGYQAHKNLSLLMAATEAARRTTPGLRLLLVGADAVAQADSAVATPLPRVSRARLRALYALATLVLCPSRYEGFGLPAAQGLAAGTPVLASDIPAHREVLGDAACLLPVDAPERWANAIGSLVREAHWREDLAGAGRERADAFRWEVAARHYQALYREEGS
ncbi:MAG: glycosyltransferase family 1 protein [Thermaerobacter sp.]|nr:glycosyltransferase family 1 protein [Thermaerobacter sp.]